MLEPSTFAESLESYLDSLTPQEIRARVLESIKRLDSANRAQLALFLGLDVLGEADTGEFTIQEGELRAHIESCGLLKERFATFLRDNPGAVHGLGKDAVERILGRNSNRIMASLQRVPVKVVGLMALVVIVTFLPLVAQYVRQQGLIAGLSDIPLPPAILAPIALRPVHVHPLPRIRPEHRVARAQLAAVPRSKAGAVVHHHHSLIRASAVPPRRVAVHRLRRAHRRIAAAWKFDPAYNPYFNHRRWRSVHALARLLPKAKPRRIQVFQVADTFANRARLVVSSYISAVIRGNTASALQHLGLPLDASLTNLSELPIVTRDARAQVVAVDTQPDGRARVEVDINGRSGEYFEVFYVGHDGPAVRIMDRYYIPVNRTAEERAARLLAKDGH